MLGISQGARPWIQGDFVINSFYGIRKRTALPKYSLLLEAPHQCWGASRRREYGRLRLPKNSIK